MTFRPQSHRRTYLFIAWDAQEFTFVVHGQWSQFFSHVGTGMCTHTDIAVKLDPQLCNHCRSIGMNRTACTQMHSLVIQCGKRWPFVFRHSLVIKDLKCCFIHFLCAVLKAFVVAFWNVLTPSRHKHKEKR